MSSSARSREFESRPHRYAIFQSAYRGRIQIAAGSIASLRSSFTPPDFCTSAMDLGSITTADFECRRVATLLVLSAEDPSHAQVHQPESPRALPTPPCLAKPFYLRHPYLGPPRQPLFSRPTTLAPSSIQSARGAVVHRSNCPTYRLRWFTRVAWPPLCFAYTSDRAACPARAPVPPTTAVPTSARTVIRYSVASAPGAARAAPAHRDDMHTLLTFDLGIA
ncbi:hypothetical protein C8J57DRAFT_1721430 [Mycena rebaudengoi]|nr:hypothetical protein C8J57DRAFT_1721430 [Mycena rebaudengoi]